MPAVEELFEPALFSMPELAFLLEHLEESPNVALHGGAPKGVNRAAVEPALKRFSELDELQRLRKVPWAGHDAIRDSITRFIAWQEKCLAIQQGGGPRHPSMFSWDSTGAMYLGGTGSDAANLIRHEITDDGERIPFAVNLVNVNKNGLKLPWVGARKGTDTLRADNGVYHCSVCEKPVAFWDVKLGRRGQNKARAQAIKHCRTAKSELGRHRALATSIVE